MTNYRSLLPLTALAIAAAAPAQDLATKIRTTAAAPGVWMLDGENGFSSNMSLLAGKDRVILVDDGMAPITESLVETVMALAGRPIDFIVNTHVHGDHVGSNAALADNGALIIAHDNLRRRLVEAPDSAGGPNGYPVVTFDDAVTFHVDGQEAFVFHAAAAHTDGDAVIHFRGANVIHAGDLHFNYLFPFIDLDSGGSLEGYKAGQQRILDLADDDTVIIPGHGPLAGKADLQAALDMLVDAESRVRKLVEAGMTRDEVLAANPLAAYHDRWNWGFITTERMTEMLYRSLSSQ